MSEFDREAAKPGEGISSEDSWMAADPEAFRSSDEIREEEEAAPDGSAYTNAEAFGLTLQQYADTVQYVNSLYPDQMDVNEAQEAMDEAFESKE